MFLGLRTAIYHVNNLDGAKEWYTKILGKEPYFDQPFYTGYNVGGYELGLMPDNTESGAKVEGVVTYWEVKNANETLARLIEAGAVIHENLQDVGEGILVATVKDPFGNVLGIVENPHFTAEK